MCFEMQLTLCLFGNFACFFVVRCFFQKSTFSKNSFKITIRMSNSLDPDQARHFVGLIWGQTVCKGYQQTTLVGKELYLKSLPELTLVILNHQCTYYCCVFFQTLAGFARKNINRHDISSVLSIFPVVKHLRSIKPEFDRNLEVRPIGRNSMCPSCCSILARRVHVMSLNLLISKSPLNKLFDEPGLICLLVPDYVLITTLSCSLEKTIPLLPAQLPTSTSRQSLKKILKSPDILSDQYFFAKIYTKL